MMTYPQKVAYYFARKRRRARMLFPGGVIPGAGFFMRVTLTVE